MRGLWRVSVVTVFLSLWLFGAGSDVNAQTCSGTVGVECGSITCIRYEDGICVEQGCGAGLGWEQRLDCSVSGGQCRVENVCAQAGMCQYSVAGQCTSSGGGTECPCGINVNTGNCKACTSECRIDGYGVDCPTGWVKSTNITNSQCLGSGASCNLGSAQTQGPCCEEVWSECAEEA